LFVNDIETGVRNVYRTIREGRKGKGVWVWEQWRFPDKLIRRSRIAL